MTFTTFFEYKGFDIDEHCDNYTGEVEYAEATRKDDCFVINNRYSDKPTEWIVWEATNPELGFDSYHNEVATVECKTIEEAIDWFKEHEEEF